MTRNEAILYCTKRWNAQCERYPTMRNEIPYELYVRRNLAATLRLRADGELNPDELQIRRRALGDVSSFTNEES